MSYEQTLLLSHTYTDFVIKSPLEMGICCMLLTTH